MADTTCDVCSARFAVRFRYQVREEAGGFVHVCSMACQRKLLVGGGDARCEVCHRAFDVEYPFQMIAHDGGRAYLCSMPCREIRTG